MKNRGQSELEQNTGFCNFPFLGKGRNSLLLATVAALMLTACGGSGSDEDVPTVSDATATGVQQQLDNPTPSEFVNTSTLEGEWLMCGGPYYITIVFESNAWTRTLSTLDHSSSCDNPIVNQGPSISGTYVLDGVTTTDEGLQVQRINFIIEDSVSSSIVTNYSIVYTGTPGELLLGEYSSNTEEDRPTALDFNFVFVRQ